MKMRLRDQINDLIHRLEYLDKDLIAGFCHMEGAVKAVMVDVNEKRAVGVAIPLATIIEWNGKATLLAEEKYKELEAQMKIAIDGGRTVIVPE